MHDNATGRDWGRKEGAQMMKYHFVVCALDSGCICDVSWVPVSFLFYFIINMTTMACMAQDDRSILVSLQLCTRKYLIEPETCSKVKYITYWIASRSFYLQRMFPSEGEQRACFLGGDSGGLKEIDFSRSLQQTQFESHIGPCCFSKALISATPLSQ